MECIVGWAFYLFMVGFMDCWWILYMVLCLTGCGMICIIQCLLWARLGEAGLCKSLALSVK